MCNALKNLIVGVFAIILSAGPHIQTAPDTVEDLAAPGSDGEVYQEQEQETELPARPVRMGADNAAGGAHSSADGFYRELAERLIAHETDFVITATKEAGETLRAASLRKFAAEHPDGLYYWLLKSYPAARLTEDGGTIAFEYHNMKYRSTAEKHAYALDRAKEIAAGLKLDGLSAFAKVEKICNWADAHWSYDRTLTKELAYDVFTTGEGTCLGVTFAMRMLLDEAGVPSKAMVGANRDKTWHIWLIVQLDDYWYNIDPSYPRDQRFYLVEDLAPWYTLGSLYRTDEVKAMYPVASWWERKTVG